MHGDVGLTNGLNELLQGIESCQERQGEHDDEIIWTHQRHQLFGLSQNVEIEVEHCQQKDKDSAKGEIHNKAVL